jgi:hypothetical protein
MTATSSNGQSSQPTPLTVFGSPNFGPAPATTAVQPPVRINSSGSANSPATQPSAPRVPLRHRRIDGHYLMISNGFILLACVIIGRFIYLPAMYIALPVALFSVVGIIAAYFGLRRAKGRVATWNPKDNLVPMLALTSLLTAVLVLSILGAASLVINGVRLDTNFHAVSWQVIFYVAIAVGVFSVVWTTYVPRALPGSQNSTRPSATPSTSSSSTASTASAGRSMAQLTNMLNTPVPPTSGNGNSGNPATPTQP